MTLKWNESDPKSETMILDYEDHKNSHIFDNPKDAWDAIVAHMSRWWFARLAEGCVWEVIDINKAHGR
jgi:hypothetical protein